MFLFVFVLLSSDVDVSAQPRPDPPLAEVIKKASEARKLYEQSFKDLLTTETKTFKIFDKKGSLKKTRTVKSIFMVYQSADERNDSVEFRNVIMVDGKPVKDADARAQGLFENISKSTSAEAELRRLDSESQRFDPDIFLNGLTLYESVALHEKLRPCLEFIILGHEAVDGADTIVIGYSQIKPCPGILTDPRKLPTTREFTILYDAGLPSGTNANEHLSGKLWIDPGTFQLRREFRSMKVQPGGYTQPTPLAETEFNYRPSEFGIMTPVRIEHRLWTLLDDKKTARKDADVIFEYDKFTKPNVEVKSGDVSTSN